MHRIVFACAVGLGLVLTGTSALADDGDPDPSFDTDGRAWHTWPTTFVQAETTAVAALRDGSVVTAGWVDHGDNNRDFAVVKFRADGTLDTGFGNAGAQVIAFDLDPGGNDRAVGVFELADGKLLVVGSAGIDQSPYSLPASLRLHANGQLDTSYGVGGKNVLVENPFGSPSVIIDHAARGNDGAIVLAGLCANCGHGGLPDALAVRLTATGDADPTFGSAGWVSFGREGPDQHWMIERIGAVAIDRAGRVLLAGHEETDTDTDERQRPLLLRLDPQGGLDATFADNGLLVLDLLGSWSADAIAVDPLNDSLLVAINITNMQSVVPGSGLLRVRSTGVLDTVFGGTGFVDLGREEGTAIHALAIRGDRRVTAAGWIDPNGPGDYDFFIARTLHDGTLDASFDGNGVQRVPFDISTNSYDRAWAMTLSGERPVIAGTVFEVIGDQPYSTAVLRLKSDLIFADGLD
jgi:uncharacterized delta-60 repeat protein